jgi:hypothetical protein
MSRTRLLAAVAALPLVVAAAPASASPLRAVPLDHTIRLPGAASGHAGGISPFVIGGAPAPDGTLPSTVYVEVHFSNNSAAACTGSVVAPTFVVTAAHCFLGDGTRVTDVVVATGVHDLTQVASGVGQVIHATQVQLDPDYDPSTAHHDAAVVTLASPTAAPAVPIATADEINALGPGTALTIAGWGTTIGGDDTSAPRQLQTAQVQLQSGQYCQATLGKLEPFDPQLFLCTDTPNHVSGTCHGDSGGPLLWTAPSGASELVGLTDWGFDECTPAISAYTNMAAEGPWVLFAAGLGPEPPRAPGDHATERPAVHHRPHISGRAVPGGVLTCHIGAWGHAPTSYDIDWLYNGRLQTGVHSSRVKLSTTIHGGWARCSVTARNSVGTTRSSSAGVHVKKLKRTTTTAATRG